MKKLTVGDVVEIYKDPLTKTRFEGKAELLEKLGGNFWRVRFENGDVVLRAVSNKTQKDLKEEAMKQFVSDFKRDNRTKEKIVDVRRYEEYKKLKEDGAFENPDVGVYEYYGVGIVRVDYLDNIIYFVLDK